MEINLIPQFFHEKNPNLLNYSINSELSSYSGELVVCFEKNGAELYLDYIEIIDDLRNKGIGTKVLNWLIEFSKKFGTKRIYLLVDFDNEGAQLLYKKLGFTMTGNITPKLCYEMEYKNEILEIQGI